MDTTIEKEEQSKSFISPQEVRRILNTDNEGIKKICKQFSILPKRDAVGNAYFSSEDVDMLKRVRELHDKSQKVVRKNGLSKVKPPVSVTGANKKSEIEEIKPEVKQLLENIVKAQEGIVDKVSKVIDEKLEGMDEVVVELIRCKTENETLRQKINELNKENYKYKSEVKSYKSLGFGFYVKQNDVNFL